MLIEDNRRMAQLLCISKGDEQTTTTTMQKLMEEKKSLQEQCGLLKKRGTCCYNVSKCDDIAVEVKLEQQLLNSSNMHNVTSEPVDYAELKAERNELREVIKNFETELMQVKHMYTRLFIVLFADRSRWMLKILLATETTLKYFMSRQEYVDCSIRIV